MKTSSAEVNLAKFNYDFLDFGASKGASIEFAKEHLFGKRGLGIDLDPKRVEIMNKAGYDSMVGDLTNLQLAAKCVKFVKMSHILEHMPDLAGVEKAIVAGKKSATDFMVIAGPYFDADEYLAGKGLKLYWADYPEHPCHLKVSQLITILKKLKLNDYELYLRYPITDSSDEHIHPLASPSGSHQYNSKIHPPKKRIVFDKDVWVDFVCYVKLGETKNWDKITKAYRDQIPHAEMKAGVLHIWPEAAVKKFMAMDEQLQAKDRALRDMKLQKQQIADKMLASGKETVALKSSKAWKTARLLQKSSFAAKHPSAIIRKIRG